MAGRNRKGVIPDYDVPFGLPGTGNIGTGTNRAELLQLTDAALNGFIDMSGKPEYNGQWEDVKNQLAEEALNMRYEDWLEGDQYRALQDRYGRKGKMAMEDVLGQISSRTGGLASSYAVSAANQQYNDFMAQLEEAAMDMFANERNNAIENANLAYSYADNDYNRYLDELGQYNTDRSFAYNAYMDALAQQNYLKELENEKANIEYDRGQSSRSEAQDRISSYLAAGGKVANLDRNLIELSGLTENELYAQEAYYTGKNKNSSGSSGRSGTSSSGYMDYEGLLKMPKQVVIHRALLQTVIRIMALIRAVGFTMIIRHGMSNRKKLKKTLRETARIIILSITKITTGYLHMLGKMKCEALWKSIRKGLT